MSRLSPRTAFLALSLGVAAIGATGPALALPKGLQGTGLQPGNLQPNPGALKPGAFNPGKLGLAGGNGVKLPGNGPVLVGGPAKVPGGFGKGKGKGHGHGHGGWKGHGYGGAIAIGVASGLAVGAIAAPQPLYADDECYAVRKRLVDEDGDVVTRLVAVCD